MATKAVSKSDLSHASLTVLEIRCSQSRTNATNSRVRSYFLRASEFLERMAGLLCGEKSVRDETVVADAGPRTCSGVGPIRAQTSALENTRFAICIEMLQT